ncbi:PadR family transcriptional regulator [Effusibacillus dendaii]|uniref:PadR family transcriptional regulator n=1 Tax=Effusibacillus dendaii TaxID=2743772 RepID=A0A7I8DHY5_9BACL|nr:helix-turn-helix transcriptional regulator [Effusibacillus dendaii]BCJ87451.1 PadR family transcriptional regulator [Effusibacillus dendaii]
MEIDRDFIRGSTALLILSLLEREGELYGYQITKLIKDRTEGILDFKEGTLYPALYKLEEDAFITSEWIDTTGRKRRYYRITAKGKERLSQKKKEWNVFTRLVNGVIDYA